MILLDANLLIYMGVEGPNHELATRWFKRQMEEGHRIGIPWTSITAFLRITTNPRVYAQPASIDAAWMLVEGWLQLPMVWIPNPQERHAKILKHLLLSANAHGNLIQDAHLAALAMEHGLELCTTDGDFAQFEGLRWRHPLKRSAK